MKFSQKMSKNFFPHLRRYTGKPVRYLEIGSGNADTIDWMLKNIATNAESQLIGVEKVSVDSLPEINTEYELTMLRSRLSRVKRKSKGKVTFINRFNPEVLKGAFDIIYLNRCINNELLSKESVYLWPLLKNNGIFISNTFDIDFIKKELALLKYNYEILFLNAQLGVKIFD